MPQKLPSPLQLWAPGDCQNVYRQECRADMPLKPPTLQTGAWQPCMLADSETHVDSPHIFTRLLSKLLLGSLISFRLLFIFCSLPHTQSSRTDCGGWWGYAPHPPPGGWTESQPSTPLPSSLPSFFTLYTYITDIETSISIYDIHTIHS